LRIRFIAKKSEIEANSLRFASLRFAENLGGFAFASLRFLDVQIRRIAKKFAESSQKIFLLFFFLTFYIDKNG
jgi:hypothetical protein